MCKSQCQFKIDSQKLVQNKSSKKTQYQKYIQKMPVFFTTCLKIASCQNEGKYQKKNNILKVFSKKKTFIYKHT